MKRLRSIRVRLTLTYTLLLSGIFVLFSVGLFMALNNIIYDNFYSQINAAAEKVAKSVNVSVKFLPNIGEELKVESETVGGDVNTSTSTIKANFLNANGQIIPNSPKGDPNVATSTAAKNVAGQALANGSPQHTTVPTKNGDTSLVAVPMSLPGTAYAGSFPTYMGSYVVLMQSSLQQVEQQIALLKYILMASAAAVMLLSACGSWFLTGRVLQPITQITDKVRKITAQDLNQRLNIPARDEIGRMAATFDDMIDRLQASFERQKRFTSDASHELRTPLAVMQADLSLALRRPRSAPEYRGTLESAQEEVSRLSHIVNDLLVLARLDTDVAQIGREPVQLDDLIERVVARLRPLATERSIRLRYTINAPATMIGDQTRLKQVFINLLDNAIAYTPDGGSIHVSMVTDGMQAEVTVADTGIGIPPEDVPHVFERFYRSEEARTRNHEGTGLGLAIAQKVVQAHQGRIEVSSTPGKGTTFQVFLPLQGPLTGQGVTGRLSPLAILAAAAH